MEQEWLEEQLRAGRSLDAIAVIAGRSPSTVGYWLRKHGLRAIGAEKYGPAPPLDPIVLSELARQGMSVPQIAAQVGRTRDVVRRALRRHGIRTRGMANREAATQAAAQGARAVQLVCRHHGAVDHVLEHGTRYRCVRCRSAQVAEHRRRVKRTLIDEAGGGCVICGYSRCPAALQFHHVDPATKRFHLSHRGLGRAWAELREEAAKCVLLCATHHAEVEAGFIPLPPDVSVTRTPRGGLEPPNLD